MYCENCGNKIEENHKFCTKCGQSIDSVNVNGISSKQIHSTVDEKWWHRLLKVIYIIGYLPLLLIIPLVWNENSCSYCSDGDSFWYSLLTLVIYITIIRLIKIAVLYASMGRRPVWKSEFKKLF